MKSKGDNIVETSIPLRGTASPLTVPCKNIAMNKKTFVDIILEKIKKNKFLGVLIVFGIIVISISKFIVASKEIYDIGKVDRCETVKNDISKIGSEIKQRLNDEMTYGDILLLNDLLNNLNFLYTEASKSKCEDDILSLLKELKSKLFAKIYTEIEIWETTKRDDVRKKVNRITILTKKFVEGMKLADSEEIELL